MALDVGTATSRAQDAVAHRRLDVLLDDHLAHQFTCERWSAGPARACRQTPCIPADYARRTVRAPWSESGGSETAQLSWAAFAVSAELV